MEITANIHETNGRSVTVALPLPRLMEYQANRLVVRKALPAPPKMLTYKPEAG
jgi:hypothetical protein